MTTRPLSRGFTLIELLVVISIIALLIAVLLPSLASARESAKTVQCLTMQRQIGMAMYVYANDNEDWIYTNINDDYRFWNRKLGDEGYFFKEGFSCPSWNDNFKGQTTWYWGGYGLMNALGGVNAKMAVNIGNYQRQLGQRYILADSVHYSGSTQTYRIAGASGVNTSYGGLHVRHGNGTAANILLADGHAETAAPDRLTIFSPFTQPQWATTLSQAYDLEMKLISY